MGGIPRIPVSIYSGNLIKLSRTAVYAALNIAF